MSANEEVLRRDFLKMAAVAAAAGKLSFQAAPAVAQDSGERPTQAADVTVLNPQNRVPVSFIIDDSTCLVNMAHFGIPHFATAWPDRKK